MSSGLYSHTTRGIGTVLTAAIYNADHVNHVTNNNPLMTGAYSDSVSQMQLMTNPGGLGTEILSPHLAGEIERLRFAINRIQGTSQWYQAPVSSLATLGGGVPLVLAFAATPLTLRRTENNTIELDILSGQVGSGIGDKYYIRLLGTGANAVAELREGIAAVEVRRFSKTVIVHNIATHCQANLTVGAAGTTKLALNATGYLDVQEVATPANPGPDTLRIFARDVSGISRLVIKDSAGTESVLGSIPAVVESVRLGTVAQGPQFSVNIGAADANYDAPAGNCMIGLRKIFSDPTHSLAIRYKPIQQSISGTYATITG